MRRPEALQATLYDGFEHATPDQLNCFGVPLPGDPFWTEETLSLAQLRYPNWDMTEYS